NVWAVETIAWSGGRGRRPVVTSASQAGRGGGDGVKRPFIREPDQGQFRRSLRYVIDTICMHKPTGVLKRGLQDRPASGGSRYCAVNIVTLLSWYPWLEE